MELVHDLGEHSLSGGGCCSYLKSLIQVQNQEGRGEEPPLCKGIEIVFRMCLSFSCVEHKYNNDNGTDNQIGNLNAQSNNIIQDRKAHEGSSQSCARSIGCQIVLWIALRRTVQLTFYAQNVFVYS
jgi:hypothetical protein